MATSQTNPAAIPQDLIEKVGTAAGHIARIQSDFSTQAERETARDARENLARRAEEAAKQVISDQGITVQDYNTVLAASEGDQDLERRLLEAAREVL